MKIGILITHPTQFDVPVFRLGKDVIEVIYTDRMRIQNVYDPEINRILTFQDNNLDGYNYELLPEGCRKYCWLFNKIKNCKYDLLITIGYYKISFIFAIIIGGFYCRKNALRLDTVEFNNASLLKRLTKKILYRFLSIFINHFFVVSTLSEKFLLKCNIPVDRISKYGYISDNSFFERALKLGNHDKEALRGQLGINKEMQILLCISKHNKREAPYDTIEAFAKLNKSNLYLLLIGDGPLHDDLIRIVTQFKINNIGFAGYVNFNLLPNYYAISDVFIHDSHDEPWGVSVQEAIAAGVTVVASDRVGASVDLIRDGINGYVFNHGDVESLSNKIELALNIDAFNKALVNKEILSKWNYDVTYNNILKIIC